MGPPAAAIGARTCKVFAVRPPLCPSWADDAGDVVDRLRAQPEVPLAEHYDGPLIQSVRR